MVNHRQFIPPENQVVYNNSMWLATSLSRRLSRRLTYMWCDCESWNGSYHQMFIYLMRFSRGKFTINTIARLIKKLFTKLFFFFQNFYSLEVLFYFSFKTFFFLFNFFFVSLQSFFFKLRIMQIFRVTRSCNFFVQLLHATRLCNFFV